jgi:hypothetical protein
MTDKPRVTSMNLSSDESRESTAVNRFAENTQPSELVDNSVETPPRPLQEAIPTPTSSLKRNHPRQRQISGKNSPVPKTASFTLMKYILDQKQTTEQIQPKNGLDFFLWDQRDGKDFFFSGSTSGQKEDLQNCLRNRGQISEYSKQPSKYSTLSQCTTTTSSRFAYPLRPFFLTVSCQFVLWVILTKFLTTI